MHHTEHLLKKFEMKFHGDEETKELRKTNSTRTEVKILSCSIVLHDMVMYFIILKQCACMV